VVTGSGSFISVCGINRLVSTMKTPCFFCEVLQPLTL